MEWIKDENGDLHTKDGRFSIWTMITLHQLLDRGTESIQLKIKNFKSVASAKRVAAQWLKNRQ